MKEKFRDFLRIPPEIRPDFWQDALQKNRLSLLVICVMIFGMELFNMYRVLFLSSAGLGTLNNRIYFGMYCALFLAAGAYLAAQKLLARAPIRRRLAAQYAIVLFTLLWHVCLNAYDLMRNPPAEVTVFTTAILALAVFILMPGYFSLLCYAAAYTLFMVLAGPALSGGTRLNLTFTTIVALAVSLTHSHHWSVVIAQQREIRQINRKLYQLLQKDPLTELLNKTAFQRHAEAMLRDASQERPVQVLIFDLDDFKSINDQYGHPCGDEVLQRTAHALQALFPEDAVIGRIGGDEFAVALAAAGDCGEGVSQQMQQALGPVRWQGKTLHPRCSIGLCSVSSPDAAYAQVYDLADQALYRAKKQGKGSCCTLSIP